MRIFEEVMESDINFIFVDTLLLAHSRESNKAISENFIQQ